MSMHVFMPNVRVHVCVYVPVHVQVLVLMLMFLFIFRTHIHVYDEHFHDVHVCKNATATDDYKYSAPLC